MQSTTGPVGGSRARVIYHAPGKAFAWLHKDGSFADLQKALRARLNISKDEPLVIKQIDGDYALDIETEEEYEAFCHFAKSVSQLHISVNGGIRDQSKTGEAVAISSGASVSVILPPNPAPQPPAESDDLTLGKRKASQITADSEVAPSVAQKRKKRRKVGPDRSISAANNSTTLAAPPEPEAERGIVPGDATRDIASASAVVDANQSTVSQTQKKNKKKNTGVSQSNPTPVDLVERRLEPSTESAGAPELPPAEPSRTKKRKKTVVVDLSAVIQPPAAPQESQSTPVDQLPSLATEPSLPAEKEVTKKPPVRKRTKAAAKPSESTPTAPPPGPSAPEEHISSGTTSKPRPPVSKSGLTRPQVYVEITTKKRKTGKMDGSSTIEEGKQQESAETLTKPTTAKSRGGPRKSKKTEPTERMDSPTLRKIMDDVIAAAMRKHASASGTTTDVSENLTPPPQNKSESTVREPRLADASSLEPASSTTLLDTTPTTVDPDSVVPLTKVRIRKSQRAGVLPFPRESNSSPVSNTHHSLNDDSPALPPLLKSRDKPSNLSRSRPKRPSSPVSTTSAPLASLPPNQKAIKKPSPTTTQPEESTSSEGEDSVTPKRKPAPVSDPDDELDAFLHAAAHPSQKSVLEELPSDSEDEEDEVEREDMEVDEEEEASKFKWSGHGQSKVMGGIVDSDDDSDSESVTVDALAEAAQVKVNTQVTHVSETLDVVPSSDLEDEGEPLTQTTKPTGTVTNAATNISPTSDSPEPHMIPISNLKSAGRALDFFNEHVLDKPDPIENGPSHDVPSNDLPEDAEDPIENVDTTSTPKPNLAQRMRGRNKTASPVIARRNDAGPKTTQSSLTSPPNSMLPPPTPSRDTRLIKGDLTFSQPLDQSTPAIPGVSRKKQLISQTTVPETPAHSTWTTLSQREPSTQSMDDPGTVDELISSPTEFAAKPQKVTPQKRPISSRSTDQTPLFLPGTSQYPIPFSDLPVAEKSSSEESEEEEEEEEEEEKVLVPPSPRVLRSSTTKNRTTTPYRTLSILASQRSIFPSTPIEPFAPTPVNRSQTKPESDDDDEDSGVSDSDSDSPPPSHIPKGRRAGARDGGRGKKKGQLMVFS